MEEDYRTSINCKNSTRIKLRELEIHPRETDEDIVLRIINEIKTKENKQ
jgi:hypothetical protein